ncbi:MAG: PilZ domain-containing protein, partial [Candidatus Omnitrophica bacterium]|nr:PilZ domain-containing protein [Candidatus Omnitrophota bacterium]
NISKGGICFITYEELLPGNLLKLEIYLPGEKNPIRAFGRVAWSKRFTIASEKDYWGDRYDVGVEFIEINDSDREKIENYF